MKKRIFIILSFVLILFFGASLIYLNDSYPPSSQSIKSNITVENNENIIITNNQNHTKAIVLYPGGKVDPLAYQTFMSQFAQKDFLAIIAKMPFNLAVLNSDKLDSIINEFPEIDDWYLIGHSLGGAMAANHISTHPQEVKGLYLLASYPTKDLTNFKGKLLSIYGDQDGIINMESYKENKNKFPSQTGEHILKGGNHAQFGNYGDQKGDNSANITRAEQQTQTIDLILNSISE